MTAGLKTSGGEGGIRTLGTGVSPYNGLAKHRAFILRSVFKHLTRCEWFSVVLNAHHNHLHCHLMCHPIIAQATNAEGSLRPQSSQ
jgi:hypothetical protein